MGECLDVRELTPSLGLLIVDLTRLMAVLAREVATEVTLADSESLLVPVRDGPPALGWLNEEDMEVFMTPDVRRM